MAQWRLTSKGKTGHSGFPHKNVNALEMAFDSITAIQKAFYETFPPHHKQEEYGFEMSSSMKPTRCVFVIAC